ncbi:MAG: 16S rRNA (guanine(527)-N(7))-methyltransferase RsmG [Deltaproteobacteria bacterium]|jgi:16S rRNA (guanine527-N7)-methyltransferase|nr:16S rRNA (guanine(527)-N(7))-methyltransferase RsmG [Deltaproteobacteria bacterium]
MQKDREGEIAEGFLLAGLGLGATELRRFALLDSLLKERNEALDLTRIESDASIVRKHYVDSVLAGNLVREESGTLLDLGSGAGFPGLPIAITRPGLTLLLAEPRLKKLRFLEEAVGLLGLANVEIYPHKVGPGFDREADAVITRDFLPLCDTLELCRGILKPGKTLYLLKGAGLDRELGDAKGRGLMEGWETLEKTPYAPEAWKTKRFVLRLRRKGGGSLSEGRVRAPKVTEIAPKVTEIASEANPRLRRLLGLLQGRKAKKSGETLLFGRKACSEALANHPGLARALIARNMGELDGLKVPEGAGIILLRPETFPKLDAFGTGPPILLMAVPELNEADLLGPSSGIRLFVPFQDPANVGTIVRTATAVGVRTVLLREAANPFHPKALRASGPLAFGAGLERGPSLAELAGAGIPRLYALSARGRDINGFDPGPGPLNLAMGLEGPGLDGLFPEDGRLSIPMVGDAESLNASAAAAMALAILLPRLRS